MKIYSFLKRCLPLLILLTVIASPYAAKAQTIIRDEEIEDYLQEWLKPVFAAANLSSDQVNIILVQDSQINAFVAGGANIFIYTGLLQKTENPGEVIGVIAHEMGHITGGHLIRGREAMENASYQSILGMILGVGAAVATGDAGAVGAIGAGASSMATRAYLTNSRAFESSADQAAMTFLDKAGINQSGMESFMKKLQGQELLTASQQSQYVQTHPLTRDRISAIDERVQQSPNKDKPYPAEWNIQHKMMLAKLLGFINPQQVAWVYDDKDTSVEAMAARAIAAYRLNQVSQALKLSDALLQREPQNPYFLELKGQMLMDFGKVKEAVPYYQKAVQARPEAALIRVALAHAQIETAQNDKVVLQAAIDNLNRAQKSESRSTYLQRLLATAYGRMGNESVAKLHLAEEAVLQRRISYAREQAEAALPGLKPGTADWIRAQDILSYLETQNDGRERKEKN